ncbi:hypothetical protein GCM10009642_51580 [Nocardiopsis metallicus]
MGVPDDVGPGQVEDVVEALVTFELVEVEIVRLQHGAHRPVRNDNSLGQCFTECPSISHIEQL